MLEAVFAFAVLSGGLAALRGNRAAIALLASTGFTFWLTLAGVPYNPWLWIAVDLAAILFIWRPGMTVADALVVALYAPGWALYFLDGEEAYAASVMVSSAQFLLAVPWGKVWRRVRHAELKFDPFRDFDLRVKHG